MKEYTLNARKSYKPAPMESKIIRFLRGQSTDNQMRTLTEMRMMVDWKIERTHDFIQWMFPTDIASKYHDDAPILTEADIAIIRNDDDIKATILLSLHRMIRFYESNDNWICQRNHNFLRLTRILRCLWLAGMKHDYVSLQKALDEIYTDYHEIIGEETYLYWKNANNDEFLKGLKKSGEFCCSPPPKINDNSPLTELDARAKHGMSVPPIFNPQGEDGPVYNPAGDAPSEQNYGDYHYT